MRDQCQRDRKEKKIHGEGGQIVGDINGKNVLIIDDVISAGLSSRRAIEIVRKEKGVLSGILVALDRMEQGQSVASRDYKNTTEEITESMGVPVFSIVKLSDLKNHSDIDGKNLKQIDSYLKKFGSLN